MPAFYLFDTERHRRWKVVADGDRIRIGRSRDADVPIPHPSVSKRHVTLKRSGGRYTFRDVGSRNGTMINDLRVDSGPLENGDELRLGAIRIRFFTEVPPEDVWGGESDADRGSNGPPERAAQSATRHDGDAAATATPNPESERPPGRPQPLAGEEGGARPLPERSSAVETPPSASSPRHGDAPRAADPAPGLRLDDVALEPDAIDAIDSVDGAATTAWFDPRASTFRSAAVRTAARRRDRTPWIIGGVLTLCLAVGLALGALLPSGKAGDGSLPSGRLGARDGSAGERPGGAPRLEPQSTADLARAETSHRAAVRFCLDLLGRPPLRSELRELLPLSHEDRWVHVARWGEHVARLPDDLAGRFLALLGRPPAPDEHAWLREASGDDLEQYTFLIVSSDAYAAASHRRRRSLEQLAQSLLVDLKDRPRTKGLETLVATLKKASLPADLPRVARAVLRARGSAAVPASRADDDAWLRDLYARTLLRLPTAEERSAAVARLREGGESAARELLLELTGLPEYLEY